MGRSELEQVKGYIHRQRQHHGEHRLDKELRALCDRDPAEATALEAHQPR